jgi:hypothetical protein
VAGSSTNAFTFTYTLTTDFTFAFASGAEFTLAASSGFSAPSARNTTVTSDWRSTSEDNGTGVG